MPELAPWALNHHPVLSSTSPSSNKKAPSGSRPLNGFSWGMGDHLGETHPKFHVLAPLFRSNRNLLSAQPVTKKTSIQSMLNLPRFKKNAKFIQQGAEKQCFAQGPATVVSSKNQTKLYQTIAYYSSITGTSSVWLEELYNHAHETPLRD